MTSIEPQPAALPPRRPWFQFNLRTLLLLFVVLASTMAVFGPGGIIVFVLILYLAICTRQVKSLWSLSYFLVALLCGMCFLGMLLPAFSSAREAGRRASCLNRIKQIAFALHAYHQDNGCFPPVYVADKTGKPLYSWRVLILPYIDCDPLYKTFNLSEPWDSPNNRSVSAAELREFICPSDIDGGPSQTSYVAVVGPDSAWAGDKSRKLTDFKNKSHTILLVEVLNSGISWAEPKDLSVQSIGAAPGKVSLTVSSNHHPEADFFFTYDHRPGANVAMADGSVHCLRPDALSPENLQKILKVGGCSAQAIESFEDPPLRLNWPNIAALAVWLLSLISLLTHAVRGRNRLMQSVVGSSPIPASFSGR